LTTVLSLAKTKDFLTTFKTFEIFKTPGFMQTFEIFKTPGFMLQPFFPPTHILSNLFQILKKN
jgi:hypothetical protein